MILVHLGVDKRMMRLLGFFCLCVALARSEEAVVVSASIDGLSIPVRLRMDDVVAEAQAAVSRFDLSRRSVAHCVARNGSCVADLLALEASLISRSSGRRLRFDRPREGEVFVLGDVEASISVEEVIDGQWQRVGQFSGDLFVDIFPAEKGNLALGESTASGWIDAKDGTFALRLEPRHRRAEGGGSSVFPVRGLLRMNVAAYDLKSGWIHAGLSVVYRPFAEPDPPRVALDRALLTQKKNNASTLIKKSAYATLLYDDDNGYVHGALALFQSIIDNRRNSSAELVALLGEGVGQVSRTALEALGVQKLIDISFPSLIPEASSALPGLGLGQWTKLALWRLPYDRVLYLDADAIVLRNVDELFYALDREQTLGAVNDYFAGAVLLVRPDANTAQAFENTLHGDGGRYVYGEQDFLNAHFSGSHALLGREYHCLAEATAQQLLNDTDINDDALDVHDRLIRGDPTHCAILEFSSCARDGAGRPWKPWHGRSQLQPHRRVCLYYPNAAFDKIAQIWERAHLRALALLLAANVELPRPFLLPP